MKKAALAVVALAATLIAVPAAQAHHAKPTVTCTSMSLAYVSTPGTTFSGELYVNDKLAASWSRTFTAVDSTGTMNVPFSAPNGNVSVYSRWRFSTGESTGLNRIWLTCQTPAPAPVAPVVPAVSAPQPAVAMAPPLYHPKPKVKKRHRVVCKNGALRVRSKRHGKVIVRCVRPRPHPTVQFLAG